MIIIPDSEKVKWAHAVIAARNAEEAIQALEKIWLDGYRTAELEVTHSVCEEVRHE